MKKDFKDWAASYSNFEGCFDGKYWFCGIEPGGVKKEHDKENNYESWFKNLELKERTKPYKPDRRDDKDSNFDQKISKLIRSIHKQSEKEKIEKLIEKNGWLKLNLYPISFPEFNHSYWTKTHYEKTGFLTKDEYLNWCRDQRFETIGNALGKGEAKTIICCGKQFRSDFILAFLGKEKAKEFLFKEPKLIPLESKTKKGNPKNKIEIIEVNDEKVRRLIITPFFGRGGIMSDADIEKLAELVLLSNI